MSGYEPEASAAVTFCSITSEVAPPPVSTWILAWVRLNSATRASIAFFEVSVWPCQSSTVTVPSGATPSAEPQAARAGAATAATAQPAEALSSARRSGALWDEGAVE